MGVSKYRNNNCDETADERSSESVPVRDQHLRGGRSCTDYFSVVSIPPASLEVALPDHLPRVTYDACHQMS